LLLPKGALLSMQNSPTLEIERLVRDQLQGVHTCIPGKIESFDAAKCLAVITPTGQFIAPSGKKLDFPKCYDAPVLAQQYAGQNVTLAFPIKAGDECLLFFSEQQLDRFRDGEEAKCDLRFDLSNAIALVGLFRQANGVVKEACDNDAVIIDHNGQSRITVKKDEQTCRVQSATLTIKGGEITAKAQHIKWDGDVEITGNVTARQKIDALGAITAQQTMQGMAGVSSALNSLDTHVHTSTAPGAPTSPPMPAGG
jgi:hypothetical protein